MSGLFNASSDRLLITSNIPAWSSELTMLAYFKMREATGSLQTLFTRLLDDVSFYNWIGLISDLTAYYELQDGTNRANFTPYPTDEWHTIAVTLSGSSSLTGFNMYLDETNIIQWEWPSTALYTPPTRMEMGGWRSTNGNRWNGDIGPIKYWARTLTQAQVIAERGYAEPQDADGIYGWWPMDTTDFGTDRSGNGNDWTVLGAIDLTDNPPGVIFPSSGISVPVAMHHNQQQGFN